MNRIESINLEDKQNRTGFTLWANSPTAMIPEFHTAMRARCIVTYVSAFAALKWPQLPAYSDFHTTMWQRVQLEHTMFKSMWKNICALITLLVLISLAPLKWNSSILTHPNREVSPARTASFPRPCDVLRDCKKGPEQLFQVKRSLLDHQGSNRCTRSRQNAKWIIFKMMLAVFTS